MKRILVFTGWYPTPDEKLKSTFVSQQVKMLQEILPVITGESWKFVVWNECFPTDLINLLRGQRIKNLDWMDENVPVFMNRGLVLSHRIPFDQTVLRWRPMRNTMIKVNRELGGSPDLVWTITLSSASLWCLFSEQIKLEVPFILQEHSVPLTMHLKRNAQKIQAPKTINKAKSIVVVAQRQISEFKRLVPSIKPIVIWNAVSDVFLSPRFDRTTSEKFSFLFVGRITYQKGIDRLVKAALYMKNKGLNFVIRIIGSGEDQIEVQSKIASSNLNSFFEWLGPKVPKEVSQIMDTCHVFVLPSLYENCPVSLLEAQSRGMPCVVTRNEASERVLLDGNGVVANESGDGSELARAMEKIMNIYIEFDVEAIQNRSRAEFSSEIFANRMLNVFLNAIS